MSRIEWINCPKCGYRMQRRWTDGKLYCEYCHGHNDTTYHIADTGKMVSLDYIEMTKLRGDEIVELRAKNLRLGWELAIAKTRLRLIRKIALYASRVQTLDPSEYDNWMGEIIQLVDGTSTELESEIGLDGQPYRLDESEIERRRAWKPY